MNESHLFADDLFNDDQLKSAIAQILDITEKHCSRIQGIRPPLSSQVVHYQEIIDQFGKYRGAPLFYPYLGSGIGHGALVELADGSIKYDFISGIGAHFGHSHPKLLKAGLKAALKDTVMQGNLMQNSESFTLTELLVKFSRMDHCVLTTSGAMANENALKIIFQKKFPRNRILAFEKCFMGRTLALSQITDRPAFREMLPHLVHVDYIPFYDWKDPIGSTQKAVHALNTFISRYPDHYACMCFELIQGEAGSYPGKYEFFIALLKILKQHHIAVFVDEIQTFGRTDHLFAYQHFGIEEYVDVVSVGKLLQVCATLFRKEFIPRQSLISQTFTGASSSIEAAITIINSLTQEGYLGLNGKNAQLRKYFVEKLQRLADLYPNCIEGPFGHGLMIALTAFKGDKEKTVAYAKALFDAGVIVFTAGSNPTRMRFLIPAGGVNYEDIDNVSAILENTLKKIQ